MTARKVAKKQKFSEPDRTEWRKVDWKPSFTSDYTEEDYAEDQEGCIAQEFWAPKGRKYPLWAFSMRDGLDPKDFSKSKGVTVTLAFLEHGKSRWKTGTEILTVPPMIALRFGVFVSDKVPLSQEDRDLMMFEKIQKATNDARKARALSRKRGS